MPPDNSCIFCAETGGILLWRDAVCRVVLADEVAYPGLCRVIANAHAKEMTDLLAAHRLRLFEAVMATEEALRRILSPDKINLASLGNLVPHVHWHVIPRFRDDAHFPAPIWAQATRSTPPRTVPGDLEAQLRNALREKL